MRPRLRPILPRVHGGVGADETLLPAGRRPFRIVPIQCLLVAGPFVAEKLAEGLQTATAGNQAIPEIMSDFVAKMAQQSAIRLLLQGALLLAMDIVRLGDVDGNQSVVVTGEHALGIAAVPVLEKLERQPRTPVSVLGRNRQAQAEQRVEHAPLGDLQAEPRDAVALAGYVGNGPVQPART